MALIAPRLIGALMPNMPGTDMPLFTMKPGDAGVHLVGAAVFVLGGLSAGFRKDMRGLPRVPYVFWVLWLIAFICMAALSRGGFVAVTAALLVASTLEPIAIGRRVAVAAVIAAVAAMLAGGALVVASLNVENSSQQADDSGEREI